MSETRSVMGAATQRRFQPYPAYKDSGVEWLGEIPAHWEVKRLKTIATVQLSNVDKKSVEGQEPVRLCNYTDVYYNDRITSELDFMSATATREQSRRFSLRAGDVLITKDSESWTDIAVPSVVVEDLPEVLCGYHLAHVRPGPGSVGAFLSRAFAAVGPRDQFRVAANGITRFGLGGDAIQNGLFAMPPEPEQRAIAAFLDRETARIDALMAKKERLIELLQEKREALIARALTKGLDPTVPMKDSGVEWLTEIPGHWQVRKLGRLLSERPRNGLSPAIGPIGDTPTFSTAAVKDGIVEIDGNIKYTVVDPREAAPFLVRKGDLFLLRGSGSRSFVGRAGILLCEPPAGCIYPDILIRLRPASWLTVWFLVNCLNSTVIRPQIEAAAKTSTGIWKVSAEDLCTLALPVPPLREQLNLEAHLTKAAAGLSLATAKVREAIDRLKELRAALISAAVTGKIDVRAVP